MKRPKPPRRPPTTRKSSQAWARAIGLNAAVANDNGHGYRRRRDDPPPGTIVELEIAPPKAG